MKYLFDFDPAHLLTVGTVGKPGQRTFYIQAQRGRELASFMAEKEADSSAWYRTRTPQRRNRC